MSQPIITSTSGCVRCVKVRLDASGKRLVGYVTLNAGEHRISDGLNNPDPFFFINTEELMPEEGILQRAILKDAVSYVAALEEPERPASMRATGRFCRTSIELVRPATALVGEVFIPTGQNIAMVLNDRRRFINLRNVVFGDAPESYSYLALAKSVSRTWDVLADGTST